MRRAVADQIKALNELTDIVARSGHSYDLSDPLTAPREAAPVRRVEPARSEPPRAPRPAPAPVAPPRPAAADRDPVGLSICRRAPRARISRRSVGHSSRKSRHRRVACR